MWQLFLQLQTGKAELNDTLEAVLRSLEAFLNYKKRYYALSSKDEKIALLRYLDAKDGTSIKSKLAIYKAWWSVNKGKTISVPQRDNARLVSIVM